MAIPKHVKQLYSTIRSAIGPLGGAGAGGAIYGEVTMTSFHRLLLYLQSTTHLNNDSIFLDIGKCSQQQVVCVWVQVFKCSWTDVENSLFFLLLCGLVASSSGAGLGKPNLHAAAYIKCCSVG